MEQADKKLGREPEYFRCFLCREQVQIRYSKWDKPYFVCDPCGIQAFIRKERGIKKLRKLVTGLKAVNPVIELISELEALEIKLAEIQDEKPIFGENADLEMRERALIREISRVSKELNTGKSGI